MITKTIEGIEGWDKVRAALLSADVEIRKKAFIGLKRAGIKLQRASMQEVPIHKGNLRASAFTRAEEGTTLLSMPKVLVGYTAAYAVYVHENLEAAHGKAFNEKHAKEIANAKTPAQRKMWFNRGEKQKAKFLEDPARRMNEELLKTVMESIEGVKPS